MMRNWLVFRDLFDSLLLGPDRGSRQFVQAARDLSGRMHGLIGIDLRPTLHGDQWELRTSTRPVRMQDCLPNSVTWAWAGLFDAVSRNATYRYCARPACRRLFETGRPDQLCCTTTCGDAHRHARQRGAVEERPEVSETVRRGPVARRPKGGRTR